MNGELQRHLSSEQKIVERWNKECFKGERVLFLFMHWDNIVIIKLIIDIKVWFIWNVNMNDNDNKYFSKYMKRETYYILIHMCVCTYTDIQYIYSFRIYVIRVSFYE